jgi:hypothetical protein
VTVGEFRAFAEATKFVTQSEQAGSSGVFDPTTHSWGSSTAPTGIIPSAHRRRRPARTIR